MYLLGSGYFDSISWLQTDCVSALRNVLLPVLLDDFFERSCFNDPAVSPSNFSSYKQQECWNRSDAVGFHEHPIGWFVDVDFDYPECISEIVFHLFEDWVHDFAGSAPCCEEVD